MNTALMIFDPRTPTTGTVIDEPQHLTLFLLGHPVWRQRSRSAEALPMVFQAAMLMEATADTAYPMLVVDDDRISLTIASKILQSVSASPILTCQDSRRVLKLLAQQPVTIIFLDLMMPHIGGETLLSAIVRDYPETPVIILTGAQDMDTAVRCIKEGAFDYVTKPIEPGRLSTVVKNALAFRQLQRENRALRQRVMVPGLTRPDVFAGIITRNVQMQVLFQHAEAIAPTGEPVLITGETGAGKDLLAHAIHVLSERRGTVVSVNVAGLDDNVFSDTLFGHARGAFTGAERARAGLVEQAASGTLFLDEIGDLALASQAKLLRLLQEGDYFPLGQDLPKRNAARIISATHRDLWQLAQQGTFRKDLNFRLRTHHLHLPSLRERPDDLPLLVEHFLTAAAAQLNKPKLQVPDKLLPLLESYSFPGNIRELRTMIFDAASRNTNRVLSTEPLERYIKHRQTEQRPAMPDAAPLAPELSCGDPTVADDPDAALCIRFPKLLPTLKQTATLLVREALRRCGGNQSAAAKLLGITQQALSERLKKMSIPIATDPEAPVAVTRRTPRSSMGNQIR